MRKRILLVAMLALLTGAAPTWAHVTVAPKEAAKGATGTFTFTVPNEERDHATVAIEIVFPDGANFATVSPAPKAGWTVAPGPSSVRWSGGTITGAQREQFAVTLGPLPNDETIVFKAVQEYDNGAVVRWIDVPTGSEEPDHPAPSVRLTGDPVPVATTTPVTSPTPSVMRPDVEEDEDSGTAWIVFAALVFVGIGIGIAMVARRRPLSRG